MIPYAGPLADVPEPPFCVTYGIVLVALVFADNVSYVVAFRQLSIPLGAAFGNSGIEGTRTRIEADRDRDHVYRAGDGSGRVVR